jgi:hypothetical protein
MTIRSNDCFVQMCTTWRLASEARNNKSSYTVKHYCDYNEVCALCIGLHCSNKLHSLWGTSRPFESNNHVRSTVNRAAGEEKRYRTVYETSFVITCKYSALQLYQPEISLPQQSTFILRISGSRRQTLWINNREISRDLTVLPFDPTVHFEPDI